jgi:hypothetical protein
MSQNLRKHAAMLRTISKARPDLRKKLLELADEGLIRSICECADNTLKGHVKLNSVQKKRLLRHKRILRKLARPGETWRQKKKYILQSGGFLAPLIAPILGTLGTLLANYISK